MVRQGSMHSLCASVLECPAPRVPHLAQHLDQSSAQHLPADRLAQLSSASQRQRGTGQQSVGLNAALGARAHQPETEPRVPGRTCQICCEAPCEGRE